MVVADIFLLLHHFTSFVMFINEFKFSYVSFYLVAYLDVEYVKFYFNIDHYNLSIVNRLR